MERYQCLVCGGALEQREGDLHVCLCCGRTFRDDRLERELSALSMLFSAEKQEQIANARQLMWEAAHTENVDSARLLSAAQYIRRMLPDDFRATFYEQVCVLSPQEMAHFLSEIDVEAHSEDMEELIDFLMASLHPAWLLPVSTLIEAAFGGEGQADLYVTYSRKLEEKAKEVSEGIYQADLSRDVFVAYSSKDMGEVMALVSYLEEEGFSCYVAQRNLRHGIGAVQNYETELQKAMHHCKVFLFVSSKQSRSLSCDAFTKEIQYLKDTEKAAAPAEYRNLSYESIPTTYKMRRLEYVIEPYAMPATAVDLEVKSFFSGVSWCRSKEEVASRLLSLVRTYTATTPPPSEKYCIRCLSKNGAQVKFCSECGGSEFASSEAEAQAMLARAKAQAEREAEELRRRLAEEQERASAQTASTGASESLQDKAKSLFDDVRSRVTEGLGAALAKGKEALDHLLDGRASHDTPQGKTSAESEGHDTPKGKAYYTPDGKIARAKPSYFGETPGDYLKNHDFTPDAPPSHTTKKPSSSFAKGKANRCFGFRSGMLWKKVLSVAYMLFILICVLVVFTDTEQPADLADCIILLALCTPYIFLSDTPLRKKLPLFKERKALYSFLGMLIVLLVMFILVGITATTP